LNGRQWSESEKARVAELYPTRPTKEIAALLGRSVTTIYQTAHKLGLRKSAEFFALPESGILRKGQTRPESVAHQFKKGQIPANKGLRRPGWAPGRMRETQFKKGARTGAAARNWKPIGTILADHEGFLHVKVREYVYGQEHSGTGNLSVWPLLNRHVWEQHHGPIPPKHIVSFKDRDRSNCAIENLELISMADNARRNQMWAHMPRELAEVIQLNGALKRKLRKLEGHGEKQDRRSA
jgi:hypothetical protein